MALAETIFVDKCEVVSIASTYCAGNQKVITLQIRRADVIEKDGVEIARSFHRHTLAPGTVGIGTTFADNIYKIHAITRSSLTGIITCRNCSFDYRSSTIN